MDELQIFDFERDFAGSVRCIPMIVRIRREAEPASVERVRPSRSRAIGRHAMRNAR
jgi:hypothetical protein